jgi:hypothetical protein
MVCWRRSGRRSPHGRPGGTRVTSTTCISARSERPRQAMVRPSRTTGPVLTPFAAPIGLPMSSTDPGAWDDQTRLVKALCEVLNAHDVQYLVFGRVSRGDSKGVALRTLDVDVVPEASPVNLQRLCDALNTLLPRRRDDALADLIASKTTSRSGEGSRAVLPLGQMTELHAQSMHMQSSSSSARSESRSRVAVGWRGYLSQRRPRCCQRRSQKPPPVWRSWATGRRDH